jgi:hypothetical protein
MCIWRKWAPVWLGWDAHRPAWLENAAIDPLKYDRYRVGQGMFRRLAVVLSVIALGLLLNGCTKCGPIWDDWVQSPKSCKSDRL